MEKEKFYISTAIAYTSSKPHIGNTYEIVLADAIARYKRLKNFDVYFQTGTDEHGQKIEQNAIENNMKTQDYVDKIAKQVQDIWDIMNVSYDKFVRTTEENHKKQVQKMFKKLYDQKDIYLGNYEGYYCIPCESFFTKSQLEDGKCPDCGSDVELTKEEVYFFDLKKYEKRLLKHVEENPDFIQPESRRNEMINNFLKPGLQDLSVSRTSFKWGIEVDFDPEHIVYVWLDALSNYITNIGYDVDNPTDEFNKLWPCDIHLVGKDIMRFHTIYWPIFLMALNIELPKVVFGHPWLLSGTEKMSKSLGNVMYADDLVNIFGVDAIRYYVLSQTPYANDGTITYEQIIDTFNADLVNTLGNLVNRTLGMAKKYFNSNVKYNDLNDNINNELINTIDNLDKKIDKAFEKYEVGLSIKYIFDLLHDSNKFIDLQEPWNLAKDEEKTKELEDVLYILLESIRVSAILLEPFIPDASVNILNQLNTKDKSLNFNKSNNYELNDAQILFKRIDKEEKLEEIFKDS